MSNFFYSHLKNVSKYPDVQRCEYGQCDADERKRHIWISQEIISEKSNVKWRTFKPVQLLLQLTERLLAKAHTRTHTHTHTHTQQQQTPHLHRGRKEKTGEKNRSPKRKQRCGVRRLCIAISSIAPSRCLRDSCESQTTGSVTSC